MGQNEDFVRSALVKINKKIAITINTPTSEVLTPLTIEDVPKSVELIYKMGGALVGFINEELHPLLKEIGEGTAELKKSKNVVGRYGSLADAMRDLYLQVLNSKVEAPFEKAQHYVLSMINHLLGSVFEFNTQMILMFEARLGEVELELGIDLESYRARFTAWFDAIKQQTVQFIGQEKERSSPLLK